MATGATIPSAKKKGPSIKQKVAFKEVVKGSSLTQAMIKAGYSRSTAKRTNKLTRTHGWQELIEKYLPEKDLAKLHKRLLQKEEVIVVSDGAKEGSHIEWTGQPHSDALRALETGYKLRGRMREKEDDPRGNIYNFNFFNEDQLRKVAARTVNGGTTSTPQLN